MMTKGKNTGSTQVELALAAPVLLLMMLGAVDFGRAFYHAVTVVNAAGVGAFYGSQSTVKSGHYDGMTQAARNDAKDVGTITVTGDRFCGCPDGTRVDCVTGSCSGYGAPRVYVRLRASQQFDPMVKYPGLPNPVMVRRDAYMRVQ